MFSLTRLVMYESSVIFNTCLNEENISMDYIFLIKTFVFPIMTWYDCNFTWNGYNIFYNSLNKGKNALEKDMWNFNALWINHMSEIVFLSTLTLARNHIVADSHLAKSSALYW